MSSTITCRIRVVVFSVLVALVGTTGTSHADVQVSDLFKKTAKKLVTEIAVDEMKKACGSGEHAAICGEFVSMLGDFVVESVSGQIDQKTVVQRFRDFGARALVAIAVDEIDDWLESVGLEPQTTQDLAKLRVPLQKALLCVAHDFVATSSASCPGLDTLPDEIAKYVPPSIANAASEAKELRDSTLTCLKGTGRTTAAICIARRLVAFITKHSPGLNKDLPAEFETLARVAERTMAATNSGSLFTATRNLTAALDELDEYLIASPNSHKVFDASLVAAPTCPSLAKPMEDFKHVIEESHAAHAAAIMAGLSIDTVPAKLQIPFDPACNDPSEWVGFVRDFRFQAKLSAAVHRFEIAALIGAALIDFIRNGDETRLTNDALELVAFIVARHIGSHPAQSYHCERAGTPADHYVCTSFGSLAAPKLVIKPAGGAKLKDLDPVIESYVESRYGVVSGERNCLQQLLSAVAGTGRVVAFKSGSTVLPLCWMDDSISSSRSGWNKVLAAALTSTGLAATLTPYSGVTIENADGSASALQIMRWADADVVSAPGSPSTLPTAMFAYKRIRLQANVTADGVLDALKGLLEAEDRDNASDITSVALRLVQAIEDQDRKAVVQVVLDEAMNVLKGPVGRFTNRLFGTDQCSEDDTSARCLVRAVALAFFEPLTQVIAGTSTDQEFVLSVAHNVSKIQALDQSPFLFEIGIAYSSLFVHTHTTMDDAWSQHFTVLDKWGVAVKHDRLQAGLFVGGFVDAIIRTAAGDASKKDSRWLAGGTVGWRKLGDLPIGLSFYAAWAPPIDWSNEAKAYVLGGSINLPIDFVLGD